MDIRKYREADRQALIDFWALVFPPNALHNDPELSLSAKLEYDDGIFVATNAEGIVGSAMVGYDGHRGWLYSVGVHPNWRMQGIGLALVTRACEHLKHVGCMKINLQVRTHNEAVVKLYAAAGFLIEDMISMGMRLPVRELIGTQIGPPIQD